MDVHQFSPENRECVSDCVPGLAFPQSHQGGQDGPLAHLSVSALGCPFSVHLSLVLFLSSGLFSNGLSY